MATMTVLVTGHANADFPPVLEAARVYPKAKALKCDRIRIEQCNGARVAEFSLDQIERFWRHSGLFPSVDRALQRDRGDYDIRRPVWNLSRPKE